MPRCVVLGVGRYSIELTPKGLVILPPAPILNRKYGKGVRGVGQRQGSNRGISKGGGLEGDGSKDKDLVLFCL